MKHQNCKIYYQIFGEKWGRSYSKSAKYQCAQCDKIKGNLWIVILMTLWTLISMTLAIKGDIDSLKQKVAALTIMKNLRQKSISQSQQRLNSYTNFKSNQNSNSRIVKSTVNFDNFKQIIRQQQDKTGFYIKILTNYMQIVGSIATFNLSIPSGIFEFPQSIGEPIKQTMNSLDCALVQFDTNIPIIYLRLMFSMLIPMCYIVLFLLGIAINTLINKSKKFPWYIVSTATMFLIIYVQPGLVAQIIALMSCRQIGDTKYILANVSFECYTSEHQQYIGFLMIPLLLLWVFILPIILFLMLRKNRENLNTTEIQLKYGFLYKEYKTRAFYWEFVKMAEKIAIILSLNFYSQFIIITVYGLLSLFIEPYQESDINEFYVNSTNICAVTVLLGIFMYKNNYAYFVYTSLVLIVLVNVWFIMKLLKKIVGGYIIKVQDILLTIFTVLSKKIPFFKKCIKEKKPQRKMNPVIQQKMRKLFQRYIDMKPKEKKKFFLNMLNLKLDLTYKHLFIKCDEKEGPTSNKSLLEISKKQKKDGKQEIEIMDRVQFDIGNQETEQKLKNDLYNSSRNNIEGKSNQKLEVQFDSPDPIMLIEKKQKEEEIIQENLIHLTMNEELEED